MMYLIAAAFVFGKEDNFEYQKEILQNDFACLEFTLTLEKIQVNGIDLITFNNKGQIIEFRVFIRPLQGVNKIH